MSVRRVTGQPDLVQRFVECLPFDEAVRIKAVARPFRTAARRALTRGRWRPLRFLDERGEGAARASISDTPPHPLSGTFSCDEINLLHEAWAIAPGEVLLIMLGWEPALTPGQIESTYIASVFLRFLEPGIRYQQDIDHLRKALADDFLGNRGPRLPVSFLERSDGGFERIVAALEYCNSKLINVPVRHISRQRMVALLVEWCGRAHYDEYPERFSSDYYWILSSPRWLGRQLAHWADPVHAAKFVISGHFLSYMDAEILGGRMTTGWLAGPAALNFDRHLRAWAQSSEGQLALAFTPSGPGAPPLNHDPDDDY